jgi:hypothetical protein
MVVAIESSVFGRSKSARNIHELNQLFELFTNIAALHTVTICDYFKKIM